MYSYPSPAGGIQIVHPMEMFLKQIDRTSFQHFFCGMPYAYVSWASRARLDRPIGLSRRNNGIQENME